MGRKAMSKASSTEQLFMVRHFLSICPLLFL